MVSRLIKAQPCKAEVIFIYIGGTMFLTWLGNYVILFHFCYFLTCVETLLKSGGCGSRY